METSNSPSLAPADKTSSSTRLDPFVEAVRQKLLDRSQAGLLKYGHGLDRKDLNTLQWLRHAQEEALDFANYLEVLIQREEGSVLHLHTLIRDLQNEMDPHKRVELTHKIRENVENLSRPRT